MSTLSSPLVLNHRWTFPRVTGLYGGGRTRQVPLEDSTYVGPERQVTGLSEVSGARSEDDRRE